MLPASTGERTQRAVSRGRPDGRTVEIQRLIGRALRSVCDFEALGERTLWLDCDVLQADGGTRCASITGAWIAASRALDRFGLSKALAARSRRSRSGSSAARRSSTSTTRRTRRAETDMNVVMTGEGELVEVQATAERDPFSRELLDAAARPRRRRHRGAHGRPGARPRPPPRAREAASSPRGTRTSCASCGGAPGVGDRAPRARRTSRSRTARPSSRTPGSRRGTGGARSARGMGRGRGLRDRGRCARRPARGSSRLAGRTTRRAPARGARRRRGPRRALRLRARGARPGRLGAPCARHARGRDRPRAARERGLRLRPDLRPARRVAHRRGARQCVEGRALAPRAGGAGARRSARSARDRGSVGPMDAAQALAELAELSSQVERAVVLGRGRLGARARPDERGAEALARSRARPRSPRPASSTPRRATSRGRRSSSPKAALFVLREGGRARSRRRPGRSPTAGLVVYDLRTCLQGIDEPKAEAATRDREKPKEEEDE